MGAEPCPGGRNRPGTRGATVEPGPQTGLGLWAARQQSRPPQSTTASGRRAGWGAHSRSCGLVQQGRGLVDGFGPGVRFSHEVQAEGGAPEAATASPVCPGPFHRRLRFQPRLLWLDPHAPCLLRRGPDTTVPSRVLWEVRTAQQGLGPPGAKLLGLRCLGGAGDPHTVKPRSISGKTGEGPGQRHMCGGPQYMVKEGKKEPPSPHSHGRTRP